MYTLLPNCFFVSVVFISDRLIVQTSFPVTSLHLDSCKFAKILSTQCIEPSGTREVRYFSKTHVHDCLHSNGLLRF